MKLPNASRAVVPVEKLVDYLLDETHPDGGSKAVFFRRAGFRPEAWGELAAALLLHATENDVASEEETEHGRKFVIEAVIAMPAGQRPLVRSIWVILRGEDTPRFVSAYPLASRRD